VITLYQVVITAYGVMTTPFIVMPDFDPNNSQIYLKMVLSAQNNLIFVDIFKENGDILSPKSIKTVFSFNINCVKCMDTLKFLPLSL
jgi:branched-subunit amino acid transport protein AzlD